MWNRLGASAQLARMCYSRLTRDHSPQDLSAPGLCLREFMLGGGEVSRSHRRLSAGTRSHAEAFPYRRSARRSGTTAVSGGRGAALPANRLTRHHPPLWASKTGCPSTVSVCTTEEEKQWKITSSSTKASKVE